ncbi:MAG: STAS domain-containing protein [Candidatus Omnitrophica bacterium]|nr:STAS domain-containing protein [Candidatus Omnitrophota bacterium]MBU1128915.1 STAS domain-containing protein [Candidatus Omnitrophota bacterium]MBU1784923.1 STAS domain-containing protein [Candidatus Omnitrophota bacterium]
MRIREQIDGDELTMFLDGNFDESSGFVVEGELDKIMSKNIKDIILDMEDVKYISSIGIRVLMLAHKKSIKSGKKITIANIFGKAREILEMVGILPLFTG